MRPTGTHFRREQTRTFLDVGKQKYTKRRKKIPPEESMPTNGEIIMVAEEYTTKRKKRADTYPVVLEEQQVPSILFHLYFI